MSVLQRYGTAQGSLSSTSRDLTRVRGQADLGLAKIEAAAQIQATKTDAMVYVGQRAMHNVTLLSKLEEQLTLACPQSSGRNAVIADITAVACAQVVSETVQKVSRA